MKTIFRKNKTVFRLFKFHIIWMVLAGSVFLFSNRVSAEFYEYINEDGVKCYTDDPSKIPVKKTNDLVIHKERYDDLDAQQRQLYIEKENQIIEEEKQEKRRQIEEYEEEEQQRQALEAERERLKSKFTRVIIDHNRILVPVVFGYNGNETTATMILDTGASMTALHRSVAGRIKMPPGEKTLARVAGGGFINTWSVPIDYIKVGAKKWDLPTIMVIPEAGPRQFYDGLLGQDFLGRFGYTIDYAKSAIQWTQQD